MTDRNKYETKLNVQMEKDLDKGYTAARCNWALARLKKLVSSGRANFKKNKAHPTAEIGSLMFERSM